MLLFPRIEIPVVEGNMGPRLRGLLSKSLVKLLRIIFVMFSKSLMSFVLSSYVAKGM